jgi:hypothetical protein
MIKILKRFNPISNWKRKQERRQMTKDWLHQSDPIRIMIFHILCQFKILVMILIVFLFIMTISECIWTWSNISEKIIIKGGNKYWMEKPIKQIDNI